MDEQDRQDVLSPTGFSRKSPCSGQATIIRCFTLEWSARSGGRSTACLKQKKKELSTKGHEERRRATKALGLTATGCQGHEGIIDFQLFHSRMIRPVRGQEHGLSETNEKRVIHEGPRRTTKGHEGVGVNRDGMPRSRKDYRFPIVSLSNDPHRRGGRGPGLSETNEKRQKKKELSTKGHEERRRATKALRLTATGCQGREGIIDF